MSETHATGPLPELDEAPAPVPVLVLTVDASWEDATGTLQEAAAGTPFPETAPAEMREDFLRLGWARYEEAR